MMLLNVLFVILSIAWYDVTADVFGYGEDNNMVINPGFDKTLGDEWTISKAVVTRTAKASHKGNSGLHITDRTSKDGGVYQRLYFADNPALIPGTTYYMSARVKFLDNATETTTPKWYITAKYMFKFVYEDRANNHQGSAGRLMFETADSTWNVVGGDVDCPELASGAVPLYLQVYVRVEPQVINYYLDSFAVTPVEEIGADWKTTLQAKIDVVRKRNLQITTTIPDDVNVADTSITVEWQKPLFDWGTAIQANHLSGDDPFQVNLKAYILRTFTWIGFIAGMKWKTMEPERDVWKFTPVSTSVDWLVDNGICVRGHAYLWEIMENNPLWAQALVGQELKDRVMNRIKKTGTFFRNKICDWDLCNEYLHQHFYEGRISERGPSLIAQEMEVAHTGDPASLLCINDYGILRDSQTTVNQVNLAYKLRDHLQAPLGCIGAQGHIRNPDDYSLSKFLKRLQVISDPKLRVIISELSVQTDDVARRAEILEQVMYAAFSEKYVHGVIYWGLTDSNGLQFEDDTALLHGPDFVPNAAGEIFEELILNTWTTPDYTLNPDSRIYEDTRVVYQGKYKVTLYVNGEKRVCKSVTVGKATTKTLDLSF